ncbi:ammonium transporter [Nesterenkonia sp. MY13]|uniref:Ammonium transporter n=1 Tax=Nesterenkonia sedimenti TaxID=1463632 RepID=A0A7X8TK53_9MICC|nr:ammonium transporter [Nesterenkonia sedimenti]NLS10069.1 ammonium transporter [Nesterenkonia sedimenti]
MEVYEVVWLIVAGALVLFMTPGLALFYGGLSKAKSAVNMMMMSFAAMGLVALVWALWGDSMAFGESVGALFGNPADNFAQSDMVGSEDQYALVEVGFGATFAIITTALISGAIADRAKFSTWMIFVPIWMTLVYAPLAHWVWGDGLLTTGPIGSAVGEAVDFAGGLVVHMCAGLAALALVLVIGPRSDFAPTRGHNMPLVLLGASILWFGWFGFNVGEAGDAAQVGINWINTMLCPAAALVAWLITEWARGQKPTATGAASGIVAGLVAITPACAYVTPIWAIVIGIVSGVICQIAVNLKFTLKYDDTLDVVGLHFVAGLWGTIAIGLFADESLLAADEFEYAGGLLTGGGIDLLIAQAVACLVTLVFTFVVTYIIGLALHKTIGFRVEPDVEEEGIDSAAHGETAYELAAPAAKE